jgi:flagellar protein FlaI
MDDEPDATNRPPTKVTDDDALDILEGLRGGEEPGMAVTPEMGETGEGPPSTRVPEAGLGDTQELDDRLGTHLREVERSAEELDLDPDRELCPVPPIESEEVEEVEFTTIREDRSHVRVLFNHQDNRYFYQAIEPPLDERESEALEFLRDTLKRTLERPPPESNWDRFLRQATDRAILDHSVMIDSTARDRVVYYLVRDFLGYGPIDVMMGDPMVEDISCDGPGIPVYVYHRNHESMRSNLGWEDEDALDSFVRKLAQRSGKHISIANPLLDATLPDTSRLQATLSREVTTRGSSFTIRRFRADPLTPPDLVRYGTMSARMAAYYWLAVEEERSLIFSGGTASGKTTTLNAVGQFIPPDRKIVTIEDTREMNLEHENWVASLTRSGFGGEGGTGDVSMYELLESALRQRPEYLIVGEVRGKEAETLFQAMATGHATYSTLHADSVRGAVHRLENPPIDIPRSMLGALDVISLQTQVRVGGSIERRISEVTELVEIDPKTQELVTRTAFRWDQGEDEHKRVADSQILEEIRRKRNISSEEIQEEWDRRTDVIQWMVENGVRQITDVWDAVSAYYKDPEEVAAAVRDDTGEGTP